MKLKRQGCCSYPRAVSEIWERSKTQCMLQFRISGKSTSETIVCWIQLSSSIKKWSGIVVDGGMTNGVTFFHCIAPLFWFALHLVCNMACVAILVIFLLEWPRRRLLVSLRRPVHSGLRCLRWQRQFYARLQGSVTEKFIKHCHSHRGKEGWSLPWISELYTGLKLWSLRVSWIA